MKLKAEINGENLELDIKREGDRLLATIDDREYSLEISEPEKGVMLFKKEGQVFEIFLSQPASLEIPTHVAIRGSEYDVSITDPKRLRGATGDHSHTGGTIEIKTAMPGKVVRLLAAVGDAV